MNELHVFPKASISIDTTCGKILAIGRWKDVKLPKARIIDAKGLLIFPGFIDSHTHPLYAGSRVNEFEQRGAGIDYLEILRQGGGIFATVESTCKAPQSTLTAKALSTFSRMLSHGTTTAEAKSGYGLSLREELRQLRLLRQLKKQSPLELFTTFLGAHAIPKKYEKNHSAYVNLICRKMLPEIAKLKLADFCDVFCEPEIFSVEQSYKICAKAQGYGLQLRLHADEFESSGGAELGVRLGAASVDHLAGISLQGIKALGKTMTVATLLPCTTFFLGKEKYAPARSLIDEGGIVALATDFNAGSNLSYSMQMALSLGLLKMRLTPEEIVVAGTLHPAWSLGAADRLGSLHPGKQADLILMEGDDYRETFYHFGTNQVKLTIKRGTVVQETARAAKRKGNAGMTLQLGNEIASK